MNNKSFTLALTFVGIYLLTSGISLAVFSVTGGGSGSFLLGGLGGKSKINLDLPKTEQCPINGGMFSKPEREAWESRRPLAIMVENHADSRPPSGLTKADVVYEAVAEGGITRFLSIFYCGVADDVQVAPVRSVRIYYIDYASEYGDKPILMHVGGANNYSGSGDTVKEVRALETLETIGWRFAKGNDFDTTYDSGFPVFWRNYERLDHAVATEHTMMASTAAAYKQAEKRGFAFTDEDGVAWNENFTPWKFTKDNSQGGASEISFGFWDNKPDYDVTWKYDPTSNSYLRFNAGKEHMDLGYNQQISAKNVVILFAKEKGPVDINQHMFYTTTGTGEAIIFQNGKAIAATWEKDKRQARTIFTDESGDEISFVGGPIWIEIVPAGNNVNY